MSKSPSGSPLSVILLAVAALFVLSLLPWGDLTGNCLKNFSLISDLIPESDRSFVTHEEIDPALAALTATGTATNATTDTYAADTVAVTLPPTSLPDSFDAPRDDGTVLIEDYSSGTATASLRKSFAATSARMVRVAVIGDSYIEGDIFTQNVRSLLQDRYGGAGVGYMAAHSNFPGFRQSVRQTSQGWTERDMRHIGTDSVKPLAGVYYSAAPGATVTYKGSRRPPHADAWERSLLMFIAPAEGTITLTTDGGEVTHTIAALPEIQSVRLDGHTTKLTVRTDINGLKMLGAWLEGNTGIGVDCMSMRGNSGITHRNVSDIIARQSRKWIDYDLIIFEYGINALTSVQKDYSAYESAMVSAVNKVKSQYPGAAILVMAIGDRGQKHGTTVGSIATAQAMVMAQRNVARRTGSLFWDTRAAMGGNDAAVDWHKRALVNSDYIHLNHKGGAELARIFVNALTRSLDE